MRAEKGAGEQRRKEKGIERKVAGNRERGRREGEKEREKRKRREGRGGERGREGERERERGRRKTKALRLEKAASLGMHQTLLESEQIGQ
jgi:hypothetical protein